MLLQKLSAFAQTITVDPADFGLDPDQFETFLEFPEPAETFANQTAIGTALIVIAIIAAVALMAIILMQSKRSAGFTSAVAGSGGSDTYFAKNKGRSVEGALEKYTKILGTVFLLIALILTFILI